MTLGERIAAREHRCRDCKAPLWTHLEVPYCDACLRRINAAYRQPVSPFVQAALDRRLTPKALG